ncbi:MAG: hypothetical protein HKL96_08000 [Phycisphaerales bacterium]|nr:hypothetical protein [Phycisphaerales bacterium]
MKIRALLLLAVPAMCAGCAQHRPMAAGPGAALADPANASAPAGPAISTGSILSVTQAAREIAPPPLLLGRHIPGSNTTGHAPAPATPAMKTKAMNMPGMNMQPNGGQ